MDFPFFYMQADLEEGVVITPPEDTARHMVQVLRMREDEQLIVTNGLGRSAMCTILSVSKRSCMIQVGPVTVMPERSKRVIIAISLLKNASRFEWFLEKSAELGVARIVPLLCERTEKQHFRQDRANGILISAMQQSQQVWLTELSSPLPFEQYIRERPAGEAFIAHCEPSEKQVLSGTGVRQATILIGPEGDFSPTEILQAVQQGYTPVTLGDTRLRTETAGIAAAVKLLIV